MTPRTHGIMIVLGVASVVAVLAYGLLAVNQSPEPNPTFWVFAAVFILFLVWDLARHVRAIRSRVSDPRDGVR